MKDLEVPIFYNHLDVKVKGVHYMCKIILIPIGSYEQHGKLLPHETDSIICTNIAKDVSTYFDNSVLLPTIHYGLSQEHLMVGNTITLSLNTYFNLLQDIVSGVNMAFPDSSLLVIINGHGGNQNAAAAVCSYQNYSARFPKALSVHVFSDSMRKLACELLGDFNAHADSVESSVLATMTGEITEGIYYLDDLDEISVPKHRLRYFPVRELSKQGIITSENRIIVNRKIGQQLIDNSVHFIVEQIHQTLEIIEGEE